MDVQEVRRSLLRWYDAHKRDLPWRRTTDPYAVLVSEVMCQQTLVDVVVPYFEAWMARWPDVHALAAADEDDVLAAWSGLGYYRRARNLHAAAQRIAADGWPDDLRELPGVGPYIAGAVASIAFGRPVAAVDGNVQRVLARMGDIRDDVTKAAGRTAIEAMATDLVDPDRPGDWTQAVMELGAMVCTPTSPRCDACPVVDHCATDAPENLPVKAPKPRPIDEAVHFAVIQDADRVLMVRRPAGGLLGGTWGLPGGTADAPLEDLVREQTGLVVRPTEMHGRTEHVFSHRRWSMQVHGADVLDGEVAGGRWVALGGLDAIGLSTAMRKALQAVPAPQAH